MKSQLLMIVLLGLSLGTAGAWNGAADIFGRGYSTLTLAQSKRLRLES